MFKALSIVMLVLLFTNCTTSNTESNDESIVFAENTNSLLQSLESDSLGASADTAGIKILMGCGYAGQSSVQFGLIKQFIVAKKYDVLTKNLSSKDELLQIISVVALEELHKRKLITITSQENELISKIKASSVKFYICNGCTGHYYGIISDIFAGKCLIDVPLFIRAKLGFEN